MPQINVVSVEFIFYSLYDEIKIKFIKLASERGNGRKLKNTGQGEL